MVGTFFRDVNWSTAVSVKTVAAALVGIVLIAATALTFTYMIFRSGNTFSATGDVTTEATVRTREGYTFSLPITWREREPNQADTYVFENNGHSIRIRTVETITTTTLIPAPATPVALQNNIVAHRYRDYDPASGKAMDRVVIPRAAGGFVEVSGYGPIFERLLDSFTFVN